MKDPSKPPRCEYHREPFSMTDTHQCKLPARWKVREMWHGHFMIRYRCSRHAAGEARTPWLEAGSP